MTWLPILMLALGGFFVGGAWSFRKQRNTVGFWIVMVMAVVCVVSGILLAGAPQ